MGKTKAQIQEDLFSVREELVTVELELKDLQKQRASLVKANIDLSNTIASIKDTYSAVIGILDIVEKGFFYVLLNVSKIRSLIKSIVVVFKKKGLDEA